MQQRLRIYDNKKDVPNHTYNGKKTMQKRKGESPNRTLVIITACALSSFSGWELSNWWSFSGHGEEKVAQVHGMALSAPALPPLNLSFLSLPCFCLFLLLQTVRRQVLNTSEGSFSHTHTLYVYCFRSSCGSARWTVLGCV